MRQKRTHPRDLRASETEAALSRYGNSGELRVDFGDLTMPVVEVRVTTRVRSARFGRMSA